MAPDDPIKLENERRRKVRETQHPCPMCTMPGLVPQGGGRTCWLECECGGFSAIRPTWEEALANTEGWRNVDPELNAAMHPAVGCPRITLNPSTRIRPMLMSDRDLALRALFDAYDEGKMTEAEVRASPDFQELERESAGRDLTCLFRVTEEGLRRAKESLWVSIPSS